MTQFTILKQDMSEEAKHNTFLRFEILDIKTLEMYFLGAAKSILNVLIRRLSCIIFKKDLPIRNFKFRNFFESVYDLLKMY